jgi:hypothetical protein
MNTTNNELRCSIIHSQASSHEYIISDMLLESSVLQTIQIQEIQTEFFLSVYQKYNFEH